MKNTKSYIAILAIIAGFGIYRVNTSENDPVPDIINQLRQGKSVVLDSGVVYNFTGYINIPVKGVLDLNGATIKADSMIYQNFNDNNHLFILDTFAVLKSSSTAMGVINGPNGRNVSLKPGYFNAVKALKGVQIENIKFINCDKMAIMATGDRFSFTDTIWVKNCLFDSTARDGSGYDIFIQYATLVATGNTFMHSRHAIDNGGSPNPIAIIRNNIFRFCFYIPINQHKIDGTNKSGAGTEIVGNYFYDIYNPMKLSEPNSGVIRIDSNYFAGNYLGTYLDGLPIPKGTNYINGEGMPPAPKINFTKRVFQLNEQITLKVTGSSMYLWNNGSRQSQITTRSTLPMVRVFSCYSKGLMDTTTILVDGGNNPYFGFRAMSNGAPIEIWRNNELIQKIPAKKFYNYTYYVFMKDSIKIRIYPGSLQFDDFVGHKGFYDTFEGNAINVKISYKNGKGSVSRKTYNVFSGYRNLAIEVTSGYIEVGR